MKWTIFTLDLRWRQTEQEFSIAKSFDELRATRIVDTIRSS